MRESEGACETGNGVKLKHIHLFNVNKSDFNEYLIYMFIASITCITPAARQMTAKTKPNKKKFFHF